MLEVELADCVAAEFMYYAFFVKIVLCSDLFNCLSNFYINLIFNDA